MWAIKNRNVGEVGIIVDQIHIPASKDSQQGKKNRKPKRTTERLRQAFLNAVNSIIELHSRLYDTAATKSMSKQKSQNLNKKHDQIDSPLLAESSSSPGPPPALLATLDHLGARFCCNGITKQFSSSLFTPRLCLGMLGKWPFEALEMLHRPGDLATELTNDVAIVAIFQLRKWNGQLQSSS